MASCYCYYVVVYTMTTCAVSKPARYSAFVATEKQRIHFMFRCVPKKFQINDAIRLLFIKIEITAD